MGVLIASIVEKFQKIWGSNGVGFYRVFVAGV